MTFTLRTAAAVACAGVLTVILRLAVRGVLPTAAVAILASAALLLLARCVFAGGRFWVVAVGTVIGLPALGACGLVDPWETHYAEVARQMIERRDAISPWWANEGWFSSKPVLLFWLEALSMKLLGAATAPDQVLAGGAHPEWAVRFPGFLIALAGAVLLHDGVARACGRRAGLFAALALWTMPGFALLSHQALTDMPLVGGVAGALGLLLQSLATSATARGNGRAAAIVLALVLVPQLVLVLVQGRPVAGDPSTCMLPGHPACAEIALAHPRLTPLLQAAIWLVPSGFLVLHVAEETRLARLLALGAWGCATFAAMAKGPAGLVIPVAAVLARCLSQRSLRSLLRLEILVGVLLAATMILPWYLAVYGRHGTPFVKDLVVHHMLDRTLTHLHDTNDGEDVGIAYFARQLAYATFPWSGIALAGVLVLPAPDSRRGLARTTLLGAAIASFVLISSMHTKFHHYALVVLPPLAALTGVQLDELLRLARRRQAWGALVLTGAAAVTAVVAREIASRPASFILLLTYRYSRTWPSTRAFSTVFAVLGVIAVVAFAMSAIARARRAGFALAAGTAFACVVVLLDGYLPRCARDGGQREILARYYEAFDRNGPLVAYQLNWKGENFYTGDALAIFVASGPPLARYLEQRRGVVYFVTERGRVDGLRRELGTVRTFEELTSADLSAEFTLVRATL